MQDLNQLKAIQARRQEIAKELEALQAEDDELAVAVKVLTRFATKSRDKSSGSDGPPRPSGTPSTFQMVDMVLASAEKEGKTGLTMREVVDTIGGRFWPGVTVAQLSPLIYRFAKQGRIGRTATGGFTRMKV